MGAKYGSRETSLEFIIVILARGLMHGKKEESRMKVFGLVNWDDVYAYISMYAAAKSL